MPAAESSAAPASAPIDHGHGLPIVVGVVETRWRQLPRPPKRHEQDPAAKAQTWRECRRRDGHLRKRFGLRQEGLGGRTSSRVPKGSH